jgi:hypothetical protein
MSLLHWYVAHTGECYVTPPQHGYHVVHYEFHQDLAEFIMIVIITYQTGTHCFINMKYYVVYVPGQVQHFIVEKLFYYFEDCMLKIQNILQYFNRLSIFFGGGYVAH